MRTSITDFCRAHTPRCICIQYPAVHLSLVPRPLPRFHVGVEWPGDEASASICTEMEAVHYMILCVHLLTTFTYVLCCAVHEKKAQG